MIDEGKIQHIVEGYLKGTDLFLVDLKVSSGNKVSVFLDGDKGVPISTCVDVSRHIESFFDRDKEDFELEVSSVGVNRPIELPRQFMKNISREITYEDEEGKKQRAKIVDADAEGVVLEKVLAKNKKKKKQISDDEMVHKMPYNLLTNVIVQVSFKKSEK